MDQKNYRVKFLHASYGLIVVLREEKDGKWFITAGSKKTYTHVLDKEPFGSRVQTGNRVNSTEKREKGVGLYKKSLKKNPKKMGSEKA